MQYIISFDIAAIFINFILFSFFVSVKKLPVVQNKVFCLILLVLSGTTVLDIGTTLLSIYTPDIPRMYYWIFNCLYFTFSNAVPLSFVLYCISLVDYFSFATKRQIHCVLLYTFLPYCIDLILIWMTPLLANTRVIIFTIDQNLIYHRGTTWFYFLYIIIAFYLLESIFLLFVNRKNVSKVNLISIILYLVTSLVTMLLQLIFQNLLINCFGLSLATLIFFFMVQKPEAFIDSSIECFNKYSFIKISGNLFRSSGNFTFISVFLDDTIFLANTFGIAQMINFMKEVANFFRQHFKDSEIYYLSQGQFCILLKNKTQKDIYATIGLIQNRFHKSWYFDSIELKLYSRMCVINCPVDAVSPEEILDVINLVQSDERYKQGVVYASDIDIEYKRRTLFIEHSLRKGLLENRFKVYYQPIFSTSKKKLIGAEALIRLQDEKGNFISPEDFIPIAEKTGTILRIGEFVFETVCKTLSHLDVKTYGIEKIDINLSVAQCMQEILAEQILTIRSIYQVPSSIINLEITETAAAHTPEILLKNMQTLAEAGIELSLDDYGSGYSNMNYMLSLPFKMIKIDKEIVWSAYKNERSNIALSATIKMIKTLGMTVLAEGVETKEQAEWLTEMGCDYLQGYFYSKAIPTDQYLELMKNDNERYLKLNGHSDEIESKDSLDDVEELISIDE